MNLKSKSALIYDYGTFLPLAQRLSKDFGKVMYFTPWESKSPQFKLTLPGKDVPGVTRVNKFFDYIDEADVIIFPDCTNSDLQLHLEACGYNVFGSRNGCELEQDRVLSKEIFKKAKLPVGPYEVIKGIDKLRKYLKTHEDVFIKVDCMRGDFESFKSCNYEYISTKLDNIEHILGRAKNEVEFIVEEELPDKVEVGYDGYCIDGKFPKKTLFGIEIKDLGYIGVFTDHNKLPEPVHLINDALIPYFTKYQYRNFFSTEVRVGKDKKGYPIDLTCFSDDTEVLTDQGWKFFKDLDRTELICTLNSDTRVIEYQEPSAYIDYWYDGEMISISSPTKVTDLLVTPNHNVWASKRNKKGKLISMRADQLSDKLYIPRTGIWNGIEEEWFIIPSLDTRNWHSGKGIGIDRTKEYPEIKIKMDDFLAFLGIYLSEGSCNQNGCIDITQFKYVEEFNLILSKLPFKYSHYNNGFQIYNKQLHNYVKQFGISGDKYVPEFIKQLSSRQIEIFLYTYTLGDGSFRDKSTRIFTSSKIMADDLQELIMKCGRVASLNIKKTKGTRMHVGSGKEYIRNNNLYIISDRPSNNTFYIEGWTHERHGLYLNKIKYEGMVYDVEVPNHILYVRRNGNPLFSGNCRMPIPPGNIYCDMYENISEIIFEGAQGKLVEAKTKGKFGVEVIINDEFAEDNWIPVEFSKKYTDNIRLRNVTYIDECYVTIPQYVKTSDMGSIVCTGNSIDECVEKIEEMADDTKAFGIDIAKGSLDKANEEIEKLKKMGYDLFK